MQNCCDKRSEVRGANDIEAFLEVDAAFDEFEAVFERYFPDENEENETYDNAYVILSEKLAQELSDKFPPTLERLST